MNTRTRIAVALRPVTLAVRFVQRHQAFVEVMVIGLVVAIVVAHVPVIGKALSELAMLIAAFAGLVKETRQ